MLDALVGGETDAERLAKLAMGSLIPKVKSLAEALRGRFCTMPSPRADMRSNRTSWRRWSRCGDRGLEAVRTRHTTCRRLQVGLGSAGVLASEIGMDMSRFSTARSPGFVARNSEVSASVAD